MITERIQSPNEIVESEAQPTQPLVVSHVKRGKHPSEILQSKPRKRGLLSKVSLSSQRTKSLDKLGRKTVQVAKTTANGISRRTLKFSITRAVRLLDFWIFLGLLLFIWAR
jgi:hypothetical protein